jgi:hypothetical protein
VVKTPSMASSEDSAAPLADERPLPHEDFPDPLVHERERCADGSDRCLCYPADAPSWEIRTQWLAIDAEAVVDPEDRR